MKIADCYQCGEPVLECTLWEVSIKSGFTCESCNNAKNSSHQAYLENASWLKEENRRIKELLNS